MSVDKHGNKVHEDPGDQLHEDRLPDGPLPSHDDPHEREGPTGRDVSIVTDSHCNKLD